MQPCRFRVDARMIPPVVLAMGLGIALLILEVPSGRGWILALPLIPFYYLGAEILARRVSIDDAGITVSKLLRTVHLDWSQVDGLDAIQSGSKLFLILQSSDTGPVLITNTIRPFDELARRIMECVPKEKTSPSAQQLLAHPPVKHGPLIQAWIICLVLAACVAGNLLGYS